MQYQKTLICILLSLSLVRELQNLKINRETIEAYTSTSTGASTNTGQSIEDDENENAPTPMPITASTFRWDMLEEEPLTCGDNKCLFLIKNNYTTTTTTTTLTSMANSTTKSKCPNPKPRIGYLVSKYPSGTKANPSFEDSWRISKYIKARFGNEDFYLDPPFQVLLDEALPHAKSLEEHRAKRLRRRMNKTMEESFVLAKMEKPSWFTEVLSIKLYDKYSCEIHGKYINETWRLDTLIDENFRKKKLREKKSCWRMKMDSREIKMRRDGNQVPVSIIQAARDCMFFQRIKDGILRTRKIIHSEPLMSIDFQIVIDPTGTVYQLDFDRTLVGRTGFRPYNSSKFNGLVNFDVKKAEAVLDAIMSWVKEKEKVLHDHDLENSNSSNYTMKYVHHEEEQNILKSKTLPCLAMERVAINRGTTTSTIRLRSRNNMDASNTPIYSNEKDTKNPKPMTHPYAVALLRRAIAGGFYGEEYLNPTADIIADGHGWDCNIFGDRVRQNIGSVN